MLKVDETTGLRETENLVYKIQDKHAVIFQIKATENDPEKFHIPDFLDGFPVTELGFQGKCSLFTTIKKLYFGKNIEIVSENFFCGQDYLEEVYFNKKLKEIRDKAFNCCDNLKKIVFPRNCELNSIGHAAFLQCYSLTNISFPDNLQTIGTSAFCDCHSLKKVKLPKKLETLEYFVFAYTSKLKILNIPENIKTIKKSFSYSSPLSKICLHSTDIIIEDGSFDSLPHMKERKIYVELGTLSLDSLLSFNNNRRYLRYNPNIIFTSFDSQLIDVQNLFEGTLVTSIL